MFLKMNFLNQYEIDKRKALNLQHFQLQNPIILKEKFWNSQFLTTQSEALFQNIKKILWGTFFGCTECAIEFLHLLHKPYWNRATLSQDYNL